VLNAVAVSLSSAESPLRHYYCFQLEPDAELADMFQALVLGMVPTLIVIPDPRSR
jgi:hypothetical protein